MAEQNLRQRLNKLAAEKGYFLQICEYSVLLIRKIDLKKHPQPCLKFEHLVEVQHFLETEN